MQGLNRRDLFPNFPNNPNIEGDPHLPENAIWNILNPDYENSLKNQLMELVKDEENQIFIHETAKISDDVTSSINFFFLSKTPSIFVIKINLLAFNDFATAPAAVSPFMLYV